VEKIGSLPIFLHVGLDFSLATEYQTRGSVGSYIIKNIYICIYIAYSNLDRKHFKLSACPEFPKWFESII
jgi:hypothetical protein